MNFQHINYFCWDSRQAKLKWLLWKWFYTLYQILHLIHPCRLSVHQTINVPINLFYFLWLILNKQDKIVLQILDDFVCMDFRSHYYVIISSVFFLLLTVTVSFILITHIHLAYTSRSTYIQINLALLATFLICFPSYIFLIHSSLNCVNFLWVWFTGE